MKIGLICFLLLCLLAAKAWSQNEPVVTDQGDTYLIKIGERADSGISLEQFIKICQQNTGLNFTYSDEDGRKLQDRKIRMFGSKVIPKDRFYTFFQTFMKIHKFACVEVGEGPEKIIVITDLQGPDKNQVISNSVFLEDPARVAEYASQPGVLVTTVFTLRYQDATRLSANLRQYFSDPNLEKTIGVGNDGLLVQSFGPTVAAMQKLIELLDVPPARPDPPQLEIVPLEFAAAEEIEPLINELIQRQQSPRGAAQRGATGEIIVDEEDYEIRILTDPRTNSLLVQAAKSDMEWVLQLIHRLDVKLESPESNFKVYKVKNVQAADLADALREFLERTQQSIQQAQTATGGRPGTAAPATLTGENELQPVIVADEQTNSLLITASKTKWQEIQFLLEHLDIRQPQVLIETALVELTTNDLAEIGVELAKISGSSFPEPGDGGKPAAVTGFGLSTLDDLDEDGFPESRIPISNGNLPLGGGLLAGVITGDDIGLPVILAAIKSTNKANILSIPSVLVTNNSQANIISETSVQTTTRTDPGGTTTPQITAGVSVNAGITLNISPSISAANYLRLNIDLQVSSFTETPQAGAVTAPPLNNRQMTTSVYVPNGSTLFIGGVAVDETRETNTGIPLLSDIPLIGWLFGRNASQGNKTTLYFFITPHIISQQDFSDLLAISYGKKLEADSVIGLGKMQRIDPKFVRPENLDAEANLQTLESIIFDIPLYNSPEGRLIENHDETSDEQ